MIDNEDIKLYKISNKCNNINYDNNNLLTNITLPDSFLAFFLLFTYSTEIYLSN